jgi:membrane protein implicated in regulation of membrane protease activity
MFAFLGVSVYLLIALVAGIMLIITAFLGTEMGFDHDADMGAFDGDGSGGIEHFEGGHGDFSGAHLSPLSLPLVLAFLTSFGGFGALFEAFKWSDLVTPGAAAALSILVAVILYFVMDRIFVQTQANSSVDYNKLVGMDAVVTVPIKDGSRGQVLVLTEARGRTLMTAVASQDLATDTPVMIEGFAGRAVIVKKKQI